MKKIYLLTALLCLGGIGIHAERITKTTYYGMKASNKSNNPCSGVTRQVCAIVEVETKVIDPNNTLATFKTKDEKGNLIKAEIKTLPKSETDIIEELLIPNDVNQETEIVK